MRGFVLGTGRGGGLSPPPLPPDGVLPDASLSAAVVSVLLLPTQRPEGRHHIGRQLSPGRSFQPNHAAFTTTSPMAGCGRGRTKIDTLGVAQSFPSRPTDPRHRRVRRFDVCHWPPLTLDQLDGVSSSHPLSMSVRLRFLGLVLGPGCP